MFQFAKFEKLKERRLTFKEWTCESWLSVLWVLPMSYSLSSDSINFNLNHHWDALIFNINTLPKKKKVKCGVIDSRHLIITELFRELYNFIRAGVWMCSGDRWRYLNRRRWETGIGRSRLVDGKSRTIPGPGGPRTLALRPAGGTWWGRWSPQRPATTMGCHFFFLIKDILKFYFYLFYFVIIILFLYLEVCCYIVGTRNRYSIF